MEGGGTGDGPAVMSRQIGGTCATTVMLRRGLPPRAMSGSMAMTCVAFEGHPSKWFALLPETTLMSKTCTDAGNQISECPVLPPGPIVTSWPGLLLRAMSESMVLLQLGSVSI